MAPESVFQVIDGVNGGIITLINGVGIDSVRSSAVQLPWESGLSRVNDQWAVISCIIFQVEFLILLGQGSFGGGIVNR